MAPIPPVVVPSTAPFSSDVVTGVETGTETSGGTKPASVSSFAGSGSDSAGVGSIISTSGTTALFTSTPTFSTSARGSLSIGVRLFGLSGWFSWSPASTAAATAAPTTPAKPAPFKASDVVFVSCVGVVISASSGAGICLSCGVEGRESGRGMFSIPCGKISRSRSSFTLSEEGASVVGGGSSAYVLGSRRSSDGVWNSYFGFSFFSVDVGGRAYSCPNAALVGVAW